QDVAAGLRHHLGANLHDLTHSAGKVDQAGQEVALVQVHDRPRWMGGCKSMAFGMSCCNVGPVTFRAALLVSPSSLIEVMAMSRYKSGSLAEGRASGAGWPPGSFSTQGMMMKKAAALGLVGALALMTGIAQAAEEK